MKTSLCYLKTPIVDQLFSISVSSFPTHANIPTLLTLEPTTLTVLAVNSPESLVRYRLLSEPEIVNLLVTNGTTASAPSSPPGHRHEADGDEDEEDDDGGSSSCQSPPSSSAGVAGQTNASTNASTNTSANSSLVQA